MSRRSSSGAPRWLFISAGEASGDWAGALLVAALRRQGCDLPFRGVGGKHLREAGVELLADSSSWGVIGLLAVLPKLPAAYRTRFRAHREWRANPPAAVILIDCGPFHMPLARIAKGLGIPVIYYLPPGSWSRRARKLSLREIADAIATPFAWSKDLLTGGRARVEWVGHPAVESARPTMAPEEAYRHYGLDASRPIVALAPGSRAQEIRHVLPVLVGAAKALAASHAGLQFVLPVAPSVSQEMVQARLAEAGLTATLLQGMEYNALQLAQVAAVCSGTATLEFTCLRLPMVVVYRTSWATTLQYRLFRQILGRQRFAAIPNIIADREVVPELMAEAATPEAVAAAVGELLTSDTARAAIKQGLEEVVGALGGPGASDRVASLVLEVIGKAPGGSVRDR